MSKFDMRTFADERTLADTVASEWLNQLPRGQSLPFCVALSGGRIARRLFESATRLAKEQRVSFASTHFFWGDERCVPPTDPESNFAAANQLLLGPMQIAPERIHRIQGELSPGEAVKNAEAEITQFAPRDPLGQPILNLIFLGMGEDGHVASLFPEETEKFMTDNAIYRSVIAVKPPPQRITLGYGPITAARQVWVLASGPGKEGALKESLREASNTPLARVLKLRPSTVIFTDIPR
jgi:6-phosphogluconolactonase